jgi:DNA-binding transcriptional LysR family regulator
MQLDAVRAFVKVADAGSFTRAAEQLGTSKARVSVLVRALESELGARLLSRTTRAVRLTPSGEALLPRARRLVADADELGSALQSGSTLAGNVRLDAPMSIARRAIIPALPQFLAAHPRLHVQLSTTDRRVDVVRDGFDCVLRVGKLRESGLFARRLGSYAMVNCASPAYLARHGVPRSLADLDRHVLVHYSLRFGAEAPAFEYMDTQRGKPRERPMRSLVTVNSTDAYHAACVAGLGIIQAPRAGMAASLAAGELLEILPEHVSEPMPLSLVHGYARHIPHHVRAVMDWLQALVTPHLT